MTRPYFVVLLVAVLLSPSLLKAQAASTAQATPGNAANGQRLFVKNTCYFCHGFAGQGGTAGARIAATPLSAQGLIRYLRRPSGAMPAFTEKVISDQELTDVHAYLKSLPAAVPARDIPLLNQLRDK